MMTIEWSGQVISAKITWRETHDVAFLPPRHWCWGYVWGFRVDTDLCTGSKAVVDSSQSSATLHGLTPDCLYHVCVRSSSALGQSNFTSPVTRLVLRDGRWLVGPFYTVMSCIRLATRRISRHDESHSGARKTFCGALCRVVSGERARILNTFIHSRNSQICWKIATR